MEPGTPSSLSWRILVLIMGAVVWSLSRPPFRKVNCQTPPGRWGGANSVIVRDRQWLYRSTSNFSGASYVLTLPKHRAATLKYLLYSRSVFGRRTDQEVLGDGHMLLQSHRGVPERSKVAVPFEVTMIGAASSYQHAVPRVKSFQASVKLVDHAHSERWILYSFWLCQPGGAPKVTKN